MCIRDRVRKGIFKVEGSTSNKVLLRNLNLGFRDSNPNPWGEINLNFFNWVNGSLTKPYGMGKYIVRNGYFENVASGSGDTFYFWYLTEEFLIENTIFHNSGQLEIQYSTNRYGCLLYTSPSPRDLSTSRMPSSA